MAVRLRKFMAAWIRIMNPITVTVSGRFGMEGRIPDRGFDPN
jgi:hypothetical protein